MKKTANLPAQAGFSLVELLIVITIVGILSTIILNSLSTSREKAYDSKIKQQLSSFRTSAEVYFANQGNYGGTIAVCNAGMFNDFSAANASPGLYIDPANLPTYAQVFCGASGASYAVKVTLYSGSAYWCIDNRGASRMIVGVPASGTFCP